jgi:hypothetical protein
VLGVDLGLFEGEEGLHVVDGYRLIVDGCGGAATGDRSRSGRFTAL